MPATIRAATVDDVEPFLEMKVEAWRWAYAGILPGEHLAALTIDDQAAAWRARSPCAWKKSSRRLQTLPLGDRE